MAERANVQSFITELGGVLGVEPPQPKDARQIAARLARLLEGWHEPEVVARYLMRTLFTVFAEDVGLLPERSFSKLLEDSLENPQHFYYAVGDLLEKMNTGVYARLLKASTSSPRLAAGAIPSM